MKHRKLFPTAMNQTVDCSDNFCDPSCPYGCYAYPDYYLPPPSPPPPPPPLSDGKDQFIPTYIIILVSVLASFFLLISYYAIIVKYCSRWNRFRPPPTQSDGQEEEFLDENHGPPIDHPVWYINTIGLQPSIINSITVFKYKKGDPLIESTDCSVCLSEFQEDDTLRLLPKCNHAFHIPCIDTWLRSHTNCPLCRAGIVPNTVTTPSNDQSGFDLSQNGDAHMMNLEGDGDLGNIPNSLNDSEVCENRVGTEDEVESTQVDDQRKGFPFFDHSKEIVNSHGYLDDKNMVMEDEQQVRRSVSMDLSCAAATIGVDVEKSESSFVWKRDGANSSLNRVVNSSSIAQSPHASRVSMKRSFSCSGGSFLSRHSPSPSSIFPL
ncbi:RING-H2 finger protein ATL54-like [Cornus florida]|uniref:RING-H2 finger protein ATL54-like n=1 Tax=Cornus florida TaxID=4283 RepID=UPI0028A102AF|nr:RING-H2 finger protein ATL54-like [Cornus florida]